MNPQTVHRLLDAGQAADLLSGIRPADSTADLALESVWAKPGRHFNACYRDPNGRLFSLCIVGADEGARVLRRLERKSRSAEGPAVVAMVAEDVLAQAFPCDYRIEHLGRCLDVSTVHAVLGGAAIETCGVAAYRAGMRCLFRYDDAAGVRAYGKISIERDDGRRRRVQRALCASTSSTTMRVPSLLGTVEATGLDLVSAAGGRSLHDTLAEAPNAEAVARAAGALAELHVAVEAPDDRVHTCNDELALLRSWTSWMAGLDASLAAPLEATLGSLEGAAPGTAPRGLSHRDFYDKQVLLDGARLWLLDVDTACTGDAELDLGNLLAHLFLRGLQWNRGTAHRELETRAELAYGSGARSEITSWYRRASLLRLACVYRLRPEWRHLTPALLEEAMPR